MTLWYVTYSCPFSRTGVGHSIIPTEEMPEFVRQYPDAEFRVYRRAECDIFTPEVVSACMGNSPSM